jgi:hypothetical protein
MGLGRGAGEPHIAFRLYPRESLMLFRRRMGILHLAKPQIPLKSP